MDGLSSRERVKMSLDLREPDRVPVDLGGGRQTSIYPEPYLKTGERLGLGQLEMALSPRDVVDRFDERFLKSLGIDFRRVGLRDVPEDKVLEPNGMRRDVWGIGWQNTGAFWSPVVHPLKDASLDDLKGYPWPDPSDERRFKGVKEEAEFLFRNTSYALIAKEPSHIYGVLTQAIYLRGMENFFVDLALNKEFAASLMERVSEYHLKLYGRYLEEVGEFVQVVHTSDDLGTQTAPYFSLAMYREMIKPRQKELMAHIKERSGAKILYHSDGAIFTLIEDLIEIGVDILNPIEPAVKDMDPSQLKATFGGKLAFHGGISQQQVLSKGGPDRVREEVKQRIRELGRGGGYILAAAQTIVPEVPAENIIAMFQAARQYGTYPLGS
jgi:uroporphyrinogen decarboxylase